MKTIQNIVWCLLVVFLAATNASALEAKKTVKKKETKQETKQEEKQPAVISRASETAPASGDVQFTLKVPATSAMFARIPVAKVNDDVIRLNELTKALASAHESMMESGELAGTISYTNILDRLINIRLVAQEASTIGLDELPEFKAEVQSNSRKNLDLLVMREITKDAKADPAEVEKRYKELAVEWKIQSILFEKDVDAKAMSDELKTGKSFDELAKKAVDDNKAKSSLKGEYLKPKDLLPALATYISTMETGSVSMPIRLVAENKPAFTIVKLEDKRYPENPEARQQAEQLALLAKKNETLTEYRKKLYTTQVTVNEKLLKKVDYDSPKANISELLADKRVVAEIKDGRKITIGALTEALQTKFYHGLEQASKDKRINNAKSETLMKIIDDELITNEGIRRGIQESDEYQDRIKEFRLTTLFTLFLEKVVVPDVQVNEDEMKAYYRKHQGEYTEPEMIKMTSLDFDSKPHAEAAIAKLKKGTDISWVRANADGVVAVEDESGVPGAVRVLTTKSLPPDTAGSRSGFKAGDFRLYSGAEGRYSVYAILDVIPAKQQTYEEVRGDVAKKVFNDSLVRNMEDWFQKLRAASDVKIYLAGG